jgi:hypothetical protein
MIFGTLEKFGIEVRSLSESLWSCGIWFCISGERINEGNNVSLGTFVTALDGFKEVHSRDRHPTFDASGMSDEEVFTTLYEVGEGRRAFQSLQGDDVWQYFLLYNIDDAVDGWEIYIFDVGGSKRILWKGIDVTTCPPHHLDRLHATTLPREEFLGVLEEFSTFAHRLLNAPR